jgi:hypothetical protein
MPEKQVHESLLSLWTERQIGWNESLHHEAPLRLSRSILNSDQYHLELCVDAFFGAAYI